MEMEEAVKVLRQKGLYAIISVIPSKFILGGDACNETHNIPIILNGFSITQQKTQWLVAYSENEINSIQEKTVETLRDAIDLILKIKDID